MKKRSNQIRILTLRKGENLETTLFRLEKGEYNNYIWMSTFLSVCIAFIEKSLLIYLP